MKTSNSYYFEDISTVFRFGKYCGRPLWSVISKDESYVYWCINNIAEFTLSKEAIKQIRMLFPMFIITSKFSNHIRETQGQDYYYENDNYLDDIEMNYCGYEEEPTYERYVGSYAQDEMGWSDDDIDTVLDGEPDAYWNID